MATIGPIWERRFGKRLIDYFIKRLTITLSPIGLKPWRIL